MGPSQELGVGPLSFPPRISPFTFSFKFVALAILVLGEIIAMTVWLDSGDLGSTSIAARLLDKWGPTAVKGVIGFVIFCLVFTQTQVRRERVSFNPGTRDYRGWPFLLGHATLLAVFVSISSDLFGGRSNAASNGAITTWLLAGVAAFACAGLTFAPLVVWRQVLRAASNVWLYALVVVAAALALGDLTRPLAQRATALTFHAVEFALRLIGTSVISDPAATLIGTSRFQVSIAPQCSGFEGIGLIVAFGSAWLWFFRDEFLFPRALILLPFSVAVIWTLNIFRIACLILIAHFGAERIAMGGFHSQAGWISFIGVALSFSLISRRVAWLRKWQMGNARAASVTSNATALYLAPFLAILAASLVSRAFSVDFEWLYGIRFVAALAALWYFRREFRQMDWRFGFVGLSVGLIVFALWVTLDARFTPTASLRDHLRPAGMPSIAWIAWLTVRVSAAVTTVPLAEELAFRGYLMRKMTSADFDVIRGRGVKIPALLLSSLAFGILHGDRWIAGAIAGACYAGCYVYKGRLGDAVLAHAVTNAALAVYVLTTGNWRLW
jgi:exosortase E/protease (VPEID-CTERM system)